MTGVGTRRCYRIQKTHSSFEYGSRLVSCRVKYVGCDRHSNLLWQAAPLDCFPNTLHLLSAPALGWDFFLRIDRIKLAPMNAKISDPTPWHAILKEGAVQTGFHQLLHFSTKSSDVKFALCVKMAVFILQAVPNCWIANYLMPTRLIIPIPIQLLILQTFLYIPHICMYIVHTPIPKMLTYDLQFLQIMKISV